VAHGRCSVYVDRMNDLHVVNKYKE
jgi:hypothetical protein